MGKISFFAKKWIAASAFGLLAMTVFALPSAAEEDKSYVYAPESCEFSVTFPEEPQTTRKCEPDAPDKCYEQISYTKVFEMSATVNFRVVCTPVSEDMKKHYSPEIMEATLRAATDQTIVQTFDTSYREAEGYKQAGLVGEGQAGRNSTIYIAQLWIGSRSALSMEAELVGDGNTEADTLYSEVLKSVHFKKEKPDEEKEEKKEEESEAEDSKDSTPQAP